MNICYISSDKYAPYLGTSLFSFLDKHQNISNINIYVFDIDISIENKNKISMMANRYNRKVCFVSENGQMTEIVKQHNLSSFGGTTSTYVKIFPYLFLKDISKVLVIDCDTIITQDLTELYNTDVQNVYMASVPEITAYYRSSEDPKIIHKNKYYYNSGVILWNLERARNNNLELKFFDAFEKYGKPLKLADQSLLNLSITDEDVIPVSFKYNFNNNLNFIFKDIRPQILEKYDKVGLGISNITYSKPVSGNAVAIIHYLGAYRPWIKWRLPPLSKWFFKYWRKSPWKNDIRESYLDEFIYERTRHNQSSISNILLTRYFPNLNSKLKKILHQK